MAAVPSELSLTPLRRRIKTNTLRLIPLYYMNILKLFTIHDHNLYDMESYRGSVE
jgi:hypothetical protein